MRLGSTEGTLIGQLDIAADELGMEGQEMEMPIEPTEGMHDVYLVTKNGQSPRVGFICVRLGSVRKITLDNFEFPGSSPEPKYTDYSKHPLGNGNGCKYPIGSHT